MPIERTKPSVPAAGVHPALPPPRELPKITYRSPACTCASWQSFALCMWTNRAEVESVAELDKLMAGMAAHYAKFSVIHLAVEHAPLPAADTRAALEAFAPHFAKQVAASALLLDVRGFWASAIRGFVMSFESLTGRDMKLKIFSTADELVSWIGPEHQRAAGVSVDEAELLRALSYLLQQSKAP